MTGRRVVLLINSLGIGGAQAQLCHLATGLRDALWDVTVVTLLPPPAPAPTMAALEDAGIRVVSITDRRDLGPLGMVGRLTRLLRDEQPEVLLSFLYHANVLGRVTGRLAGVPTVVSSIRNERFGGRGRDLLLRATAPLATTTTANSARSVVALERRGVVRPGTVAIVPNAVLAAPASPDARQRLRRGPGDRFLWLAVGRMTPQKDYASLLRAFALVVRDHEDARLWIAGDGPLRGRLDGLRTELGLQAHVEFLGFRTDVPDLLRAADALVLSSRWEGSPNVVLEAMAVGLPVVATDVGGVDELLPTPEMGLRVPAGSPGALARAMVRVTGMAPRERSRMGASARRLVQLAHDPAEITTRWIQVLTAPTDGRPASRAARAPADAVGGRP